MQYKLHRIAPNAEGWIRPSAGRLYRRGAGDYVRENGFGHEDWNFNFDLVSDGHLRGYTPATPAKGIQGELFGLVLATYDAGGWRAAGFYDGASYVSDIRQLPKSATREMAMDVFALAQQKQIAPRFLGVTLKRIEALLRSELIHSNWLTPQDRVHAFREPVPIPANLFHPGKQRMTVSYDLDESLFAKICALGDIVPSRPDEGEFEEGSRRLRTHYAAERSRAAVAAFRNSLTSFACTVCGFDFEQAFGPHGAGFIECHHTKPVSKLRAGEKTKLRDLAAVCANCHRMLHYADPMLSLDELRDILRRQRAIQPFHSDPLLLLDKGAGAMP